MYIYIYINTYIERDDSTLKLVFHAGSVSRMRCLKVPGAGANGPSCQMQGLCLWSIHTPYCSSISLNPVINPKALDLKNI